MRRVPPGFTLIELMMGASILTIVIVALMGGYFGQSFLSSNARNLTAAMNDATRVMEQIRGTCTGGVPDARPPGYTSWNEWLNAQTPGKSVRVSDPQQELVVVACQNEAGGNYCGRDQVGTGEWKVWEWQPLYDPIRVTVSVGWVQDQRVIGGTSAGMEFQSPTAGCGKDCTTYGPLTIRDTNGNGVIDSQAMVTSLVTCR